MFVFTQSGSSSSRAIKSKQLFLPKSPSASAQSQIAGSLPPRSPMTKSPALPFNNSSTLALRLASNYSLELPNPPTSKPTPNHHTPKTIPSHLTLPLVFQSLTHINPTRIASSRTFPHAKLCYCLEISPRNLGITVKVVRMG
jgi:hypothetical protein